MLNLCIINQSLKSKKYIFIFWGVILFNSCSYKSILHENEYLLSKQSIRSDNKNFSYDELKPYLKQIPNRKMFGLWRFHLGVYCMADKWRKDRKFKLWLKNTVGEVPVILDTVLTKNSAKQFKLFLNSKGYFNSTVKYLITYKKKKVKILYQIHSGNPFTIRNIHYLISDTTIGKIIEKDISNSLINKGNNFDVDVLEKERTRLTELLKSSGYYAFMKEYIIYQADSIEKNNQIELTLKIKNPTIALKNQTDSLVQTVHTCYQINHIFIYTDYNSLQSDENKYDTLIVHSKKRKSDEILGTYYFLVKSNDKLKYNPRTIIQTLFIKNNDKYNLSNVQQSYNSLSELRNFKFIDFSFESCKHIDSSVSKFSQLDCKIRLTHSAKQSFSFETEGTNSGGNLGIAGNLVYQNRNIFRGAEIMNLKLKGAMEVQNVESNNGNNEKTVLPFNTIETGIQWGFKIPKFLVPVRQELFSKYFRPKTTIATGFNYQRRPDYTRYITNITYGFDWKESKYKRHILNPIDISSVKINKDSVLTAKIESLNDLRIKNSYTDHMITAMNYSFIYNNQEINKLKDFVFFRINAEIAGNLLRLINTTFHSNQSVDGSYQLFNIRYAQYFRVDADVRFYKIFNENNKLVFRIKGGVGFPYKNLNVLPFEKSFYAGGANSIRAWRLRRIGPGSFRDSTNTLMDKTGDINLEGNVEYRFPIYKMFQGAAFIDGGNVWLRKKNTDFPGGEFNVNRFVSEIAIGCGLGLRLDFKFFIIRLDFAVPVRDPSMPLEQRWVYDDLRLKDVNFNIGIGYPF